MLIAPLRTRIDDKISNKRMTFYSRPPRITRAQEVQQTQYAEKILHGTSEDIGDELGEAIAKHDTCTDLRDGDIVLNRERNSRRRHGKSLVVGRFGRRSLEWVRLGVKYVFPTQ